MAPLDPRTKLAFGLLGIFTILITQRPLSLLLEACILLCTLSVNRSAKPLAHALKLTIPMVVLVFAIGLISFDIHVALLLSMRLFNLLTASFVFFRSMRSEEMGDGLRKLGLPYAFTFILTTAMRYVPLMGQKIRLIMDAQRSRGMDMRPRIGNVKNFLALLVPLLVQSFVLAEHLALAMESRGFQMKNRTFRRKYRMLFREYVLLIVSLALFVAFVWWERG